ncbi:Uu.00g110450.m01.CDS01 [Anthostomella pinea]|uniref:Uu.00g110450.m01.CDS01 n=1 Tax=Anthostomella pinea TaxID=933095 RepID=A0AAI8V9R5_9PEZI|nr:Uu.00g110450.m01.CDS01 [Anthostomella pinea]
MPLPSTYAALFQLWFACSITARFPDTSNATPLTYLASREIKPIFETIQQNADGSVPLFASEEDQLTPKGPKNLTKHTHSLSGPGNCKVFPGDGAWPSSSEWSALDDLTGGALLKPRPQAHICYDNSVGGVNGTPCQTMTANWTDPYFHLDDPIEMLSPLYEGMTCQPPGVFDSGNYPARREFARNTGIRLVVKNTGHDFSGKSSGAGSLSVWTHNMKELAHLPSYSDSSYSGPAIKAGAGIQGFELYAAANELGLIIMGGECPTVGVMGGWIQGGGHSPVTPLFGMGADQVLGFEVVTTDGRFVTANKDENPDLFWALRGGGGMTYGVVTSVVVKAYPDVPCSAATFAFSTGPNVTADAFKAGMKSYWKWFPEGANSQIYSYWNVFNVAGDISFTMSPFFAPNKSIAEAQAALQPFLDDMDALGIPISPNWTQFDGFYDAYKASFPVEAVINVGVVTASRLFPWQNWANPTIFNQTFEAIWQNVEDGQALFAYNMHPSWGPNGVQDNAVHPGWREAIGYMITGIVQDLTQPADELVAQRLNFTNGAMQRWRDITPGSGAYLNEADRLEPNFQWSFWGSFYPRLLALKQRYDPFNLFWAATAVGSEFFEVRSFDGYPDEDGRLCAKSDPSLYAAEGPDYVPH